MESRAHFYLHDIKTRCREFTFCTRKYSYSLNQLMHEKMTKSNQPCIIIIQGMTGAEKTALVALLLFGWMSYARLIRGNILSERQREYMEAARAIGARPGRLLRRHLWPNARQGLFVLAASDVGAVVVLAAMFSFVGLLRAPLGNVEADWGQILSLARDWIVGSPANAFEYWYTYIPASAAIVLFSMGWNLVGDGLRDVLDPRWHRVRGLGG